MPVRRHSRRTSTHPNMMSGLVRQLLLLYCTFASIAATILANSNFNCSRIDGIGKWNVRDGEHMGPSIDEIAEEGTRNKFVGARITKLPNWLDQNNIYICTDTDTSRRVPYWAWAYTQHMHTRWKRSGSEGSTSKKWIYHFRVLAKMASAICNSHSSLITSARSIFTCSVSIHFVLVQSCSVVDCSQAVIINISFAEFITKFQFNRMRAIVWCISSNLPGANEWTILRNKQWLNVHD